jgi:hypothetical protein
MALTSWLLLTGGFVAGVLVALAAVIILMWLDARSREAECETERLLAAPRRTVAPPSYPYQSERHHAEPPQVHWLPPHDPHTPAHQAGHSHAHHR